MERDISSVTILRERDVAAGIEFALVPSKPRSQWSACSLVGFWADKSDRCWFVVREKYCTMADKPWLKPTSEQAGY